MCKPPQDKCNSNFNSLLALFGLHQLLWEISHSLGGKCCYVHQLVANFWAGIVQWVYQSFFD